MWWSLTVCDSPVWTRPCGVTVIVCSWDKKFHSATCMDWTCLTLCKLRSDHSLTGKDSLQKNLYLELLNVHYNSDLSLCWLEEKLPTKFLIHKEYMFHCTYIYYFLISSWNKSMQVCETEKSVWMHVKNKWYEMNHQYFFFLQMCWIANSLLKKPLSMYIYTKETGNSPIEYGVVFHIKKYKYTELQMML